eukprot:m.136178 g.136178  ORF g.136178 m.136178 type:complete len:151 (+) comp13132_c2_seq2:163-615(+)
MFSKRRRGKRRRREKRKSIIKLIITMCYFCELFVVPSGGKSDCCGRNAGPFSYCFTLTQIAFCHRDPRFSNDEVESAYDDDADKMMPCKCFTCAVVCLPFFCLCDIATTAFHLTRKEAFSMDQCCSSCVTSQPSPPPPVMSKPTNAIGSI